MGLFDWIQWLFSVFSRPAVLKNEPWRKTKGWGKEVRDELKAQVVALHPETSLQIPSFNILLAGFIGSGKSSFINSINSVNKDELSVAKAGVGEKALSLTKEFCCYPMNPAQLQLNDTMGINPDTQSDVHIKNILKAVEGHVPAGYEDKDFSSSGTVSQTLETLALASP